jgi:hypothetical protein
MENTIAHFADLKQVVKSDGLVGAFLYDMEKTKEDVENTFTEAMFTTLTYLAAPALALPFAAAMRGTFMEKKPYVLTPEQTKREMFNRAVKDLGNKVDLSWPISSYAPKGHSYGLGDLLTEKVDFTKVGAVAGAALGTYASTKMMFPDTLPALGQIAAAYAMWPIVGAFGAAAGAVGGIVGKVTDSIVETDN